VYPRKFSAVSWPSNYATEEKATILRCYHEMGGEGYQAGRVGGRHSKRETEMQNRFGLVFGSANVL
jgi:hypothetical protein